MSDQATAYDDLPDGVVVADDTGVVVAFNRAASRLLGRSPDDAMGRSFRDVLPLHDASGRDWWSCSEPYTGIHTRTGQPERQLTLQRAAGQQGRDLLVSARYVRDEPLGPVVRLVVCLRDAAARARVDRSRADLISTVAHELRSPLTSVKGFTATLLAKWDRFSDEQKKVMLETVNSDADRVTRLLADLLDVSRIDAGRLELHRQVLHLERAVLKCFDGRIAAGEPPDRFVCTVEGELPEMWGDPDKIDQVFGNLVENALKYGAGTVTVAIVAIDGGAQVTVTDEGEGIPAELLPRVFTKFWRRGDGGRRSGTGLGLYITKGLIEAHGGEITASRAPSGGAQFRFTLPAGTPTYEV